ncbi:PIN domain-containing protein [Methylotenera sp.]|uniref:PIN domain-containing protein n=1 Tax=Methylotenera sp. TaxID=2051956 RepID=UPI002734806C|nr:type II toxin-antitoxin system VapC family toxin [Methylotenera sp.]MDP3210655.1 type II toxin-antitoxin system VapC family toxin [Methylotenera sp.]
MAVIAIDTNVLVRFLVRDDEAQFLAASKLIYDCIANSQPVLISLLVMLEAEWVLRSRYKISKLEIAAVFNKLLESKEAIFEDEESLEESLQTWKESSADFADCLIVAKSRRLGCSSLMTFDSKASALPGAQLLNSKN